MSTKHFFPDAQGVVVTALSSIVSRNSHFLALDKQNKVVYSKTHPSSQVAIISGGGSGHEPAWSGYVGDGMLSASVSGEIFASPSTKQIMAAIKSVASDAGIILAVTNYTGDNLHFGLAREKAVGMGYKVAVLPATDDVALGRKKSEDLGRRGLAGNLISLKLVGAASQSNWSFERCLELGNQCNAQLVTVGSSLDRCHVPGRAHHEAIVEDACELGMGIHNEPGHRTLSPMPSAEELTKEMLRYLLDANDPDRAFVKFARGDDIVMMINNFGGISVLELEAMTGIARNQLANDWHLSPCRTYIGTFETSLNGPGYSITLCNISGIAEAMQMQTSDILQFLDKPTAAPAWPKNNVANIVSSEEQGAVKQHASEATKDESALNTSPKVDPKAIERAIRKACDSAIAAEPELTKWDMLMGDGDCGEAVVGVCSSILKHIDAGLCKDGSLFGILDPISESVEDVGGSLGAILAILLAAFYTNLRRMYSEADHSSFALDTNTVGKALSSALENLKMYTRARVGDRTVMDALIPFAESLQKDADLGKAVEEAQRGAKETKDMKAKYGRATYVGEKPEEAEKTPDPGAWAAAVWLRGFWEGMQGDT